MNEVLLLTGGRGHPPAASAASFDAILGDVDLRVDASADLEAGLRRLDPERHALLAVNALHHTASLDRPDDEAAAHGCTLSAAGRAAIAEWHDAGHPILSLHTGIICFDDWPWWADVLGGRWVWGRSNHPPIGTVDVDLDGGGFSVTDECYQDLDVAPDVEVIARAAGGHPLAWVRTTGPGAVGVDLLGHDARSLDHPGHRRLLTGLLRRLLEVRP